MPRKIFKMLSFNNMLNNLKFSAIKYTIRSLASRKPVNIRKKVREECEEDSPLEDIQDSDYVDLSALEQSSKEMYRHVELIREREKYLIVKQKYFKTNTPNFLSWNEKMKIRNLNSTDPEEWTIDKLAESFPALPYAISKIVKSKWMKSSPNKITRHDDTVEQNWKEFREGNLKLPDDLVEHLKKFTIRQSNTLHLLESDLIKVTPPKPEPLPNSFEAIIAKYEKIKIQKIEAIEAEIPTNLLESSKQVNKERNEVKSSIGAKNKNICVSKPSEQYKPKQELFTVPGFD